MKKLNIKYLPANSKKGFRTLDGLNRPIKPAKGTILCNSLEKFGIIRPVVVAYLTFKGVKDYYIIDGQHLYFAFLRLGWDIPYTEIEIKNEQELVEALALVNNSSTPWSMQDYIQAWSHIRPDYKTLTKYFNMYDLELSTIAGILYGKTESISKVVKTGRFKVGNVSKAVKIMDFTTDLLNIIPRQDRTTNRRLVNSYIKFVYENYCTYNHANFTAYVKKNKKRLEFVNCSDDDLHNFYSKSI